MTSNVGVKYVMWIPLTAYLASGEEEKEKEKTLECIPHSKLSLGLVPHKAPFTLNWM